MNMTYLNKLRAPIFSVILAASAATGVHSAQAETVSQLMARTHVHGMSIDQKNSENIFLATHDGFFSVAGNGEVSQISPSTDDYMGFRPHPTEEDVFYASGHPASGGNTGVLRSLDGGKSWIKISDGVGGPVDFHQLTISPTDPAVMYGSFRGLQKSVDGGENWQLVSDIPEGTIDLAAGTAPRSLFAATQTGVQHSTDDGLTWSRVGAESDPVSMISVVSDGTIYAYVFGKGLLRATEDDLSWQVIEDGLPQDTYAKFFSTSVSDQGRLAMIIAATSGGPALLVVSDDGGKVWKFPGQ